MRTLHKIVSYNIPKLWYTILSIIRSACFYREKIAICCIAKNENLYIREWLEYHIKMGIDHITIYDNNDIDGEILEDVISDYINQGLCSIINFRGKKICQLEAYNNYYKNYNQYYDWIAFIDCDEYITIADHTSNNIKSILKRKEYLPYQMLHINWMCYGDCNQLCYDRRPIIERFPKPIQPLNFKWHLSIPENNHIKTIVRGGLKKVYWIHPHYCCTPYYYCCDSHGKCVNMESPFNQFDFSILYLRHYRTKSIGEYIEKIKRGYPDQSDIEAKEKLSIDDFFIVNERTQQKEDYLKNILYHNSHL